MRQIFIFLIFFTATLQGRSAFADTTRPVLNDEQKQTLFYTGKLWGFLKYYHPAVASGKYNWDEELVKMIPRCLAVKSRTERDTLLLNWVTGLGEVPVCSACNDSALITARSRPVFNWMSDGFFPAALSEKLQFIITNRKQGESYYMKFMAQDGIELPLAQHEATYGGMRFPAYEYRLLALFRFWNVIEYWYPYKYGPAGDWDGKLRMFMEGVAAQNNAREYASAIQTWVVSLQDGHGQVRSAATEEMAGNNYMPFTIRMIEKQAVITSITNDTLALTSGLQKGDVITGIDGRSITGIVDSLRRYTPASNEGDFLRKMSYRLTRTTAAQVQLAIKREEKLFSIRVNTYKVLNRSSLEPDPPLFAPQKNTTGFFMVKNSIGYINMGELDRKDSLALKKMITASRGLIIDNRQNADESNGTGAADIVAELILPEGGEYLRFGSATSAYPGVFRTTPPQDMGITGNGKGYPHKIAILTDNGTISVGEFMTMIFQYAPKAVTVGTTTAGADGNVTYLMLPGSVWVQFTGLGVYYLDGKETQRAGLVPNISVTPTVEGFRQGRDEMLEMAVKQVGSITN